MTLHTFDNFVRTTINSAVATTDTSITLDAAKAPFRNPPAPTSGRTGILTLADGLAAQSKFEIIGYGSVTTNADGTITLGSLTRGMGGTSARTWAAGNLAYQDVDADTMNALGTTAIFPESGAFAGTYGGADKSLTLQCDVYGRILSVSSQAISVPISAVTNLQNTLDAKAAANNVVNSVAGRKGAVTLQVSDITGLQASLDAKLTNGNPATFHSQAGGTAISFTDTVANGGTTLFYESHDANHWSLNRSDSSGAYAATPIYVDWSSGRVSFETVPYVNSDFVWTSGNVSPLDKNTGGTMRAPVTFNANTDAPFTLQQYSSSIYTYCQIEDYNGNPVSRMGVQPSGDGFYNIFDTSNAQKPVWSVARDTQVVSFSQRPTFGSNVPWDSGNFTPSSKANKSSPVFSNQIYLSGSNGDLSLYSDTSGEVVLDAHNPSNSTKYTINLNKYGGGVQVGGNMVWHKGNLANPAYCSTANSIHMDWGSNVSGQIGITVDSTFMGYLWRSDNFNPATKMDKSGGAFTGLVDFSQVPGIQDATNTGTYTRVPRTFVQSADPGNKAYDGDIWMW